MATSEVNRASGSQGTLIYVEDVSEPNYSPAPTPITITGITSADPPVITATGHGLSSGDRVTIAGVTGMTEINGSISAVKVVSSSTVELVEIDASGFTAYVSGGTMTAAAFHDMCVRNFNYTPGTPAEIDTTTVCSDAKEYVMGLADEGTATMDINYDPCCNAIIECESAWRAATARWFKVVLPLYPAKTQNGVTAAADTTNTVKEFQAFVQNVSWNVGVDAAIQGSIALRLTGATITIGCGL